MPDHRIRLNDEDLDLVVAALYARAAALSPKSRQRVLRLAERLAECAPGSPKLRFAWDDAAEVSA